MRLTDVLKEDFILTDLKSRKKTELLEEMISNISDKVGGLDRKKVLETVIERERLGTTGIGNGIAIPHGKVRGVDEIRVFFGRSKKGIDFDSMDKMPVYLFFMILAPENSAAAHLKILASISHLFRNQGLRADLMKAESRSEIYEIIAEADKKIRLI
jgi:nitrogen PTS system EIIA component